MLHTESQKSGGRRRDDRVGIALEAFLDVGETRVRVLDDLLQLLDDRRGRRRVGNQREENIVRDVDEHLVDVAQCNLLVALLLAQKELALPFLARNVVCQVLEAEIGIGPVLVTPGQVRHLRVLDVARFLFDHVDVAADLARGCLETKRAIEIVHLDTPVVAANASSAENVARLARDVGASRSSSVAKKPEILWIVDDTLEYPARAPAERSAAADTPHLHKRGRWV